MFFHGVAFTATTALFFFANDFTDVNVGDIPSSSGDGVATIFKPSVLRSAFTHVHLTLRSFISYVIFSNPSTISVSFPTFIVIGCHSRLSGHKYSSGNVFDVSMPMSGVVGIVLQLVKRLVNVSRARMMKLGKRVRDRKGEHRRCEKPGAEAALEVAP